MTDIIHGKLRGVRRRQHRKTVLHAVVIGLLVGSLIAILVGMQRHTAREVTALSMFGVVFVGAMVGLAIGLLQRRSWHRVAAAVDTHYQLKDRAVTALSFLRRHQQRESTIHELQIADALAHLQQIDAREVVPVVLPRTLPVAFAALLVVLGLLLVPSSSEEVDARSSVVTNPQIEAEASWLDSTMLEELRELMEEHGPTELGELVSELEKLVAQMQEPGLDVREALAKLSEMQAAISQVQAQFNLQSVDAQLEALGEALADAKPTRAAAEALDEGMYDEASAELDQLDVAELTPQEADTVAEKLKDLAQEMKAAGQKELSDAAGEMSKGLEDEDASQANGGAKRLAELTRKQALRKAIGQRLGIQLARLAESKANSRGNQNGGDGKGKSTKPTSNWGRGVTGKPLGEQATQLDSQRNRVEITGTIGEGPSQKETYHTPEGRQQARRDYQEQYHKYQKMSEEVLQNETLPLGHRRTIRRYFESIRPNSNEINEAIAPQGLAPKAMADP